MWVFMKAWTASSLAPSADPALKPNQPNQSMPVPSSVRGSECGGMGSLPWPRRLPMIFTSTSAAMPALMCTTAPPAKSSAPRWKSQPVGEKTQWAMGEYTSSDHSAMNSA